MREIYPIQCRRDYSVDADKLTAHQAIALKCLDCVAGERNEVKRCAITTCSLWSLREACLKHAIKAKTVKGRLNNIRGRGFSGQ